MNIFWAYLTTLIIFTSFRLAHILIYADRESSALTDSGELSISTNKLNQAIRIRYSSSSTIYGITIYEELLASAFDNVIVVYNISSSLRTKDVQRMQLTKPIQKKLLEFKFINHEMLLYCDALTCRFIYFLHEICSRFYCFIHFNSSSSIPQNFKD